LTLDASGTATFSGSGLTLGAVSNANTADDALLFNAGSGTVTLTSLGGSGKTRFASNASIGTLSAGTVTIDGSAISVTTLNGGALTLGTATLTASAGSFGGSIAGSGIFTKDSAGTLTLSAASTYTGATTVSAGVLAVAHADALGTSAAGTSVTSGAELRLQGGITIASEAVTLNGTGVSAGGALRNLSANNALAGAITLASASRINSDAGTLTLTGGVSSTDLGLTVGGAGNVTIDTTGLSLGTGALTKDGAGTLLLAIANTYSGATTISAGTLKIGNALSLGTSAVSVASGATLDLNGVTGFTNSITLTDGATLTGGSLPTTRIPTTGVLNVEITGSATLAKTDAGRLELTGANTFTGATNVSAGTIAVSDFGNGTTASPLGVTDLSDPSKLLLVGAGGAKPVLEFTGATGATTARSFTVGGDGAGISAGSGAGALVFTSAAKINLTNAEAEFKLVANTSAENRFEATLAENSPGLKNVKIDGTGQWVVAGPANRVAGDFRLDVAGGTLKFESGALGTGNTYASSVIAVSNGAGL
ncbi:MAG: autotransporter-associated beta strand repeat-containing protein, partial [Opitutia bacterium]